MTQQAATRKSCPKFPGGPVAKTVFPMQGAGFDPWSGTRSYTLPLRIAPIW